MSAQVVRSRWTTTPAFDHSLRIPPQKSRRSVCGGWVRTPHLQPHAAPDNFSHSPPPAQNCFGINRTSQEAGAAACRCGLQDEALAGWGKKLTPPCRSCCTGWGGSPPPPAAFILPDPTATPLCPTSLHPCAENLLWLIKAEHTSPARGMEEKLKVPKDAHVGDF